MWMASVSPPECEKVLGRAEVGGEAIVCTALAVLMATLEGGRAQRSQLASALSAL